MGFHTIIATLIITVFLISLAYTLIAGNTNLADTTLEGYKGGVKSEIERLKTDITLINVSYDPIIGELTTYVKNTGTEKFINFNKFDMFIYGTTTSGATITRYLTANYTIVNELINPNIFDPGEIASANATVSLDNGTYVLQVCTPNAICNVLDFVVG
ncbi:hypothetical protein [Geoglobus acetivorans]|uniref:Uncharacterized protein n=1 Tax=Geoglobus acetivorans TaxID=565033 RepID=A0ABZ3H4U4_GEOAI|nr:hypothetical protein [Geoglobus acetivorans]